MGCASGSPSSSYVAAPPTQAHGPLVTEWSRSGASWVSHVSVLVPGFILHPAPGTSATGWDWPVYVWGRERPVPGQIHGSSHLSTWFSWAPSHVYTLVPSHTRGVRPLPWLPATGLASLILCTFCGLENQLLCFSRSWDFDWDYVDYTDPYRKRKKKERNIFKY